MLISFSQNITSMLSFNFTPWSQIFFSISILLFFTFPSQSIYGQGEISAEITYPTKNYDCTNGFIDLTIEDAYPPYTVTWYRRTIFGLGVVQSNDNVQGQNDGEDLELDAAGTYVVEVTNALCGIARKRFRVRCKCSEDCLVSGEVTDANCNSKGQITIAVECSEEGHGVFTYLWNDGTSSRDRSGLDPGNYCLTATDADGCEYENCFQVQGTENTLDAYISNKEGNIESSQGSIQQNRPEGYIATEVTGGTKDFECTWTDEDGNVLSHSCSGLYGIEETGTYCLSVDDGCSTVIECYDIVDCENQNIQVDAEIEKTCEGVAAGSIQLSISGGTAPYDVEWDNGQTGASISDLQQGEHCAKVTDANGCSEENICFNVGVKQGEVESSTVPCERTTLCNGQEYTQSYDYVDITYDCNTESARCQATNETVSINYGWRSVWVESCVLYGLCQFENRVEVISSGGIPINGDYGAFYPNCDNNIGCYSRACEFVLGDQTVQYVDLTSFYGCPTISYVRDDDCPGRYPCRALYKCNETVVYSECTDVVCSALQGPSEGEGSAIIHQGNESTSDDMLLITSQKELLDYVNSLAKKGRQIEDGNLKRSYNNSAADSMIPFDVDVFPNPTKDQLTITLKGKIPNSYTVAMHSLLGRQVLSQNRVSDQELNRFIINMQDFPNGIYYLSITSEAGATMTKKVIKQ